MYVFYDLTLITGIMIISSGMMLASFKAAEYLYWKFMAIRTYREWKRINRKFHDED